MEKAKHDIHKGTEKNDTDKATIISVIEEEKYILTKSPESKLKNGALREGEPPVLLGRECIGLLINYAAMGIIGKGSLALIYPFFNNYLSLDGYQLVAASELITLPWTFKLFFGILSDSFPIFNLRRRPYMIIGWTICFFALIIAILLPVPQPFHLYPEDRSIPVAYVASSRLNYDAKSSGTVYILLITLATLGYIIAKVSADGMLIELAQREPEKVRGTIQTTTYMAIRIFGTFAELFVGFCMNDSSYGGEFSWSMDFRCVLICLVLASIFVIPANIWLLKEDKVVCEPFANRCTYMWSILQQRAIWQVLVFKFFGGIFSSFGAAPVGIVQKHWAKVEPFNNSIFAAISNIIFVATLWATKLYGLSWNWRTAIACSTLLMLGLDAIVSFITIFDVFRNQWFWLGVPILEEIPYGVRHIVSSFVIVEIAEIGYEGLTHGLISTMGHLSYPFSSSIYKTIDSYFDAFDDDIRRDDIYSRNQVAYTFILMYVVKIFSLLFLFLLPKQKAEAQRLKRHGGKSKLAGILVTLIGLFALIWSIVISLLSLFESTSCLKIAGGKGCS